jgi:mono/diheme cytochrome c family protein
MRPVFLVLVLIFCAVVGMSLVHTPAQGSSDVVARGQYLVMSAGKCSDCHGPHLQGGPLTFLKPGLPFLYASPKIAGLPELSSADGVKFLETGVLPNGKHARPPMPQYRFNRDDAAAIVAYLKSLK